jgi:tripartite-type tricarboxylate transporter receptor subunit TctC
VKRREFLTLLGGAARRLDVPHDPKAPARPGLSFALVHRQALNNKEINAALAEPNMKTRLADLGGDVLALSPADFGKLIADDTEKWGKVIRAANIKAD